MRIIPFLLLTMIISEALPQSNEDYNALLTWHDQKIGLQSLGIINGPVYEFQRSSRNTHKFLQSRFWTSGNITLNGQIYYNLQLMYDLNTDQIITKHPDIRYPVAISLVDVEGFEIYGRPFIRLDHPDLPDPGFYEEAFHGHSLSVYIRRVKNGKPIGGTIKFVQKDYVFISQGNSIFKLNGIRDLYQIFPEKETTIRKIKKENKLRPSRKRIDDYVKLAALLDEEL
jgi:hypothetical protein